ncbi:diguanylate cyclase domain-containing protein [Poseidonibacter sp.]
MSIGITAILSEDENINTMIARADEALYVCKSSGRNCSVIL